MRESVAYNHEIVNKRAVNAAIGVFFFVLATAFGAYIRIPLPGNPVPITLQTFFVLLAGAVLGKKLGVASQAWYLALGAIGLPMFTGALLLGPTGGYLIGFVLASFMIGTMIEHANSLAKVVASFVIGDILIHACGALWLVAGYKFHIMQAFFIGVTPFIPGEIVKIGCAALLYTKIASRSRDIYSK